MNDELNILQESEVVYAARAGVNRKKVNDIILMTGFTLNEMGKYVHVAPRTLQRKNPDEKLPSDISERVLLIQNVYIKGSIVMGSLQVFQNWMNTNNTALNGAKPKDFLDTFSGIEFIMHELGRIEHGFFA
jgi:putative toxin-antitoxin system antitoxin component (TIGR02293 family)